MPIDAKHRSELDFARELQNIADETEPIVLRGFNSLGTVSGSRKNCTTHRFILSLDVLVLRFGVANG
jgi:hypothetical protein